MKITLNTNGTITHQEQGRARLPQGCQLKLNTGKAHRTINIEQQRTRIEDELTEKVQFGIDRKAERMAKRRK